MNDQDGSIPFKLAEWILALPFVLLLLLYIIVFLIHQKRSKTWSVYRTVSWVTGIVIALWSVAGPLAHLSRENFIAHMLGHLFLGMLAPLLMASGAPVTLMLRTLPVQKARKVTRWLKTNYFKVISDPIAASVLNMGGLWLLYTTELYHWMHQNFYVYLFIHFHVFIAGYAFTVSMIYFDPLPHRRSFSYRMAVLVLALGAHSVLAKYIYAFPPAGIPKSEAETGAMLMYYGGDAIDIILIYIFCMQWYKAANPRRTGCLSPVEKS